MTTPAPTHSAPSDAGDGPAVSCGARWRRVDLHLHSPGVASFRAPDGADLESSRGRSAVVEKYVEQLIASKIELAAITDYNGVRERWFEPIRKQAAARGITVLPGAEISFQVPKHGLHVLAIFSQDQELTAINSFLQSADVDPSQPLFADDRSHRDIRCSGRIEDFLRKLREKLGCLLILPHPDQANGFCKSFRMEDAAQFLREVAPDAIEHCPESVLDRLRTTSVLAPDRLNRLAKVEFSDPKAIDEIGSKTTKSGDPRATYLKLSVLDPEALRLALHDPATRLALGAPPRAPHCRLGTFRVTSSGFLGNLEIEWNKDLNVLIGGRGAGKSAILETLRYALGIRPLADEDYRHQLVRHALGSGGRVEVILERPVDDETPRRYRVRRVLGEEPEVVELDTERVIPVPPADLLGPAGGPTIFGQREIYLVAGSEEYRLSLLDELIGEEAERRGQAVRAAIEDLEANARRIQGLRKRLAKRDELQSRLRTIDVELTVYEKHDATAKLQDASRLRSDGEHLRSAVRTVNEAGEDWNRLGAEVVTTLEGAERRLGRGESRHKALLDGAGGIVQELRQELSRLVEQGRELFAGASKQLGNVETRWKEALAPLKEEIDRIKREAHSDQLDPDRLLRLNEERARLAPQIEELSRIEGELQKDLERREEILRTVRERRLEEHRLRRERADGIGRLLEQRVKLSVELKGQRARYREDLKALLRGAGLYDTAIDNLVAPEATDGIALSAAVRGGDAEVQERFGLSEAMSTKLVEWIRADESRLHELETLIPEDSLQVSLQVGGEYRPLDQLSVGQRATAILLLLFALEGRVLVLDQPEDDLDNRFVYEDVVQILREQKGLRRASPAASSHRRDAQREYPGHRGRGADPRVGSGARGNQDRTTRLDRRS